MLTTRPVDCPYCGENFEMSVDTSGGSQEYIDLTTRLFERLGTPGVIDVDALSQHEIAETNEWSGAGRLIAVRIRRDDD